MEPNDSVNHDQKCMSRSINTSVLSLTCSTCILSMIGSCTIIATYFLFRDIRTRVRLILLHLSIMDMGIALANLVGSVRQYNVNSNNTLLDSNDTICKVQAFVAMYCTYGSVFWTNCLAVYFYFAVVHRNTKSITTILFWVSCGVSYLVPLALCIWLLLTHRLGQTPYASGGWCALVDRGKDGRVDFFLVSFGYDFFIYITFILVPILYIGTRFHIKLEIQRAKEFVHPSAWLSAVNSIDYKFLLIPLAFIFLRIWTCIVTIIFEYTDEHKKLTKMTHGCIFVDLLMSLAAIGDSGQGAANGVIFIFFTKKVRKKLFSLCRKRTDSSNHEQDPLLHAKQVLQKKSIQNRSPDYASPSPSLPSVTPPRTPSPVSSDDIYY